MFRRYPDKRTQLLVDQTAWDTARDDAGAHAGVTERGGLLLGYRRGPHLHVDYATTPGPADRASRHAFHRSVEGHQHIASQRWVYTGGTSDWLGEWHSHPEPHPHPSGTDLATWRRLAKEIRQPMVFIIFGYASEWVCVVRPRMRYVQRLILVEDSVEGRVFGDERAA